MKVRTRSWKNEPLTDKELETFHEKVQKLADETFGVDDEGDHTVEVSLTDRTRYERTHFEPVPYTHVEDYRPKGLLDKAFSVAMLNLAIATRSLDTLWQIKRGHESQP